MLIHCPCVGMSATSNFLNLQRMNRIPNENGLCGYKQNKPDAKAKQNFKIPYVFSEGRLDAWLLLHDVPV